VSPSRCQFVGGGAVVDALWSFVVVSSRCPTVSSSRCFLCLMVGGLVDVLVDVIVESLVEVLLTECRLR
jgi:hypothetical protein